MKIQKPLPPAAPVVSAPSLLPPQARYGLIAILGLAALLRFVGLHDTDIYHYDEGRNYLEAFATRAMMDGRSGVAEVVGVRDNRPAHNLVVAMMLAHVPGPRGMLLVNAAYGLLGVWLAFAIATRLWSWREGLVGAGVLALSPYHVYYSRHGVVDPAIAALSAGCLYAVLRARDAANDTRAAGWAGVAGLLLGIAFGHSVRLVPVLGCTGLALFLVGRLSVTTATLFLLGTAIPFGVFEYLQQGWKTSLGTMGPRAFWLGTYLEQYKYALRVTSGHGLSFASLPAFPHFVTALEGWPAAAWTAVAVVLACFRPTRAELALHAFWLLPLAFFSMLGNPSHRFFLIGIPFLAIAKARIAGLAAGRWPERTPVIWGVAAVLTLAQVPWLLRLRQDASPYAGMLKETGDPAFPHMTTNLAIAQSLAGHTRAGVLPGSPGESAMYKNAGFRYLIEDLQIKYGGEAATGERKAWWAAMKPKLKPVKSVPYTDFTLEIFSWNQAFTYPVHKQMLADDRKAGAAVNLYDLNTVKW